MGKSLSDIDAPWQIIALVTGVGSGEKILSCYCKLSGEILPSVFFKIVEYCHQLFGTEFARI